MQKLISKNKIKKNIKNKKNHIFQNLIGTLLRTVSVEKDDEFQIN